MENGLTFVADPAAARRPAGSTTSAPNRAFAAQLAKGQDVLDVYTYCGGFALNAAAADASSVTAVDSSAHALELAAASAARQGHGLVATFAKAEAFSLP